MIKESAMPADAKIPSQIGLPCGNDPREFQSFWHLDQCVQMIRHEKNQGAVPAMGEVVVFCALQDKRGRRGTAKLVLIAWAGADGDEKFGIFHPGRGFVF